MSAMSNLKVRVEYDKDTPRCENCKHYRKSRVILTTNSQTRKAHTHCEEHGFNVNYGGLCKTWVGKADGAVLS